MIAPRGHNLRRRGMTLIEVMISFAILVAGLVSIFAILNAGFRTHNRAIRETEASILAESMLADMRAEFAHGKIPRGDHGSFHENPDYPGYRVCRSIISLEPSRKGADPRYGDREYFVRVEVRWADQGDDKSISVDTVMYCNLR
jgi:type II secretory pathway pseudopilin PulG